MHIKQFEYLCLSLTAFVSMSVAAYADTLIERPLNSTEYGWGSTIYQGQQQTADEFSFIQAVTLERLSWYGFSEAGANANNFRIRIFADAGGQPAALPFYERTPRSTLVGINTGLTSGSPYFVRRYATDIPGVDLSAGVTYWLSVATTDSTKWTWSHSDAAPSGNSLYQRFGDAGAWFDVHATGGIGPGRLNQAFTLEGTAVPEPWGVALLGLGVVTMTSLLRLTRAVRL